MFAPTAVPSELYDNGWDVNANCSAKRMVALYVRLVCGKEFERSTGTTISVAKDKAKQIVEALINGDTDRDRAENALGCV